MGLPTRSRTTAEVTRIWNQRPDASIYWDEVPSAVGSTGIPRAFAPRYRLVWTDHFLGDSLDAKWTLSTQGTPTAGAIQNLKNGVYRLALAVTSEAETNEINFGDMLQFDPTAGLVMEVGFRFPTLPSTNERAVIGFGSARNNTYDSVATNAWFRAEASGAILAESDDGTTDTDDTSTGITVVASQWAYGRIEFKNKNDIWFSLGTGQPKRVASSTTFKTGANLVQPILGIQKSSGSGVPSLDLDYCHIYART